MPEILILIPVMFTLGLYIWWGIRFLPAERWQVFASAPAEKLADGSWRGINYTWYGILTANAYLVAVAVLLLLMGSVGVSTTGTALLTAVMLACCVPASRLVARIVEKKAHTFTVGGAVFVGILVTPFAIRLVNATAGERLSFHIPVLAAYAAIASAYAFGEGLGRLACISFGCCYGKPLSSTSGLIRKLFEGRCLVFSGETKKIAYADGLQGTEVLPVQALTALFYSGCGLASAGLFLAGHFMAAFLCATVTTQGWRSFSEVFRADYRGGGSVSAYQIMGGVGLAYAVAASLLLSGEPVPRPEFTVGLKSLWTPAVILFLQGIWVAIFLYTGRSTVTGATMSFHVNRENI